MPDGEFWRIETPEVLRGKPNVAARYENATFDRALSMRRRKAELLGLGHPLIDALIAHCQSPRQHGSVAALQDQAQAGPAVSVRCIFHLDLENGKKQRVYKHVMLAADGELRETKPRLDADLLQQSRSMGNTDGVIDAAFSISSFLLAIIPPPATWPHSRRSALPVPGPRR